MIQFYSAIFVLNYHTIFVLHYHRKILIKFKLYEYDWLHTLQNYFPIFNKIHKFARASCKQIQCTHSALYHISHYHNYRVKNLMMIKTSVLNAKKGPINQKLIMSVNYANLDISKTRWDNSIVTHELRLVVSCNIAGSYRKNYG